MKQFLTLDGLILLCLRLGNLRTRVLFEITPHTASNIYSGTSFIYGSIQEIFLSEQKMLPSHLQLMASLPLHRSPAIATTHIPNPYLIDDTAHNVVPSQFYPNLVQVGPQIIVPVNMAAQVVETTPACGLLGG